MLNITLLLLNLLETPNKKGIMSLAIFLMNFLIFILGASFGSFILSLIDRREEEISIVSPPSFCDYCGKRLGVLDLIPVFSFIFLKGKTRCCGKKISRDKLFVEISLGLIFLIAFKSFSILEFIFIAIAFSLCELISITDYKFLEIYDSDLKILLISGFIYRLIFLQIDFAFIKVCLIFSAVFLLIRWISKNGIGDGDLFFYLGIFFFLETRLIMIFILFSVWIGAIFAIIKAIRIKSMKAKIALCPAIYFAFVLVIMFKDYLWKDEPLHWLN